jgi:4a-hydroxytetrahydrobiopterin dehydratase
MSDWITARKFHESDGVEDWRVVGEGACTYFRAGSFAVGARFVNAISDLAGLEDHGPDVDLRHEGVIVRLITVAPDYYGLSERDLELARKISAVARKLGVPADPAVVQTVLVTIDAFDILKVKPFWRAVLGYQDREDSPEDLVDPRGRGASIWFQKIEAPDPQVNRIHLDIWVPPDHAEPRIAAAIAAGGRLVTDKYAPAWWTLADPEGNLADVATTMSRD